MMRFMPGAKALVLHVLCAGMLMILPAQAVEIQANLLLQDSPLAGFQFHAGKKLWPQIRIGDSLNLIREPDNMYDSRAIRVEWQGQHIGYVPRRENTDIARLMDHGVPLVARISRLAQSRDPWARVRFEILAPQREAP